MKEKKPLKFFLNKEKISELSNSNKQKIKGGSYANCWTAGGGGGGGNTTCLYSCSCSIPGKGIC